MSEDEEMKVEFSDSVKKQMDENPEIAKAMREFAAVVHQAHHAVKTGQYETLEDAIEAITGNRPHPVHFDEDESEVKH